MSQSDNPTTNKTESTNLKIRVGPFRVDKQTHDKFTLGLNSKDKKKINYSKIFRDLVWKKEIKVVKPLNDNEIKMFKELIMIRNNVNQIAKSLNRIATKNVFSETDLIDTSAKIKEINNLISYSLNQFNK